MGLNIHVENEDGAAQSIDLANVSLTHFIRVLYNFKKKPSSDHQLNKEKAGQVVQSHQGEANFKVGKVEFSRFHSSNLHIHVENAQWQDGNLVQADIQINRKKFESKGLHSSKRSLDEFLKILNRKNLQQVAEVAVDEAVSHSSTTAAKKADVAADSQAAETSSQEDKPAKKKRTSHHKKHSKHHGKKKKRSPHKSKRRLEDEAPDSLEPPSSASDEPEFAPAISLSSDASAELVPVEATQPEMRHRQKPKKRAVVELPPALPDGMSMADMKKLPPSDGSFQEDEPDKAKKTPSVREKLSRRKSSRLQAQAATAKKAKSGHPSPQAEPKPETTDVVSDDSQDKQVAIVVTKAKPKAAAKRKAAAKPKAAQKSKTEPETEDGVESELLVAGTVKRTHKSEPKPKTKPKARVKPQAQSPRWMTALKQPWLRYALGGSLAAVAASAAVYGLQAGGWLAVASISQMALICSGVAFIATGVGLWCRDFYKKQSFEALNTDGTQAGMTQTLAQLPDGEWLSVKHGFEAGKSVLNQFKSCFRPSDYQRGFYAGLQLEDVESNFDMAKVDAKRKAKA